MSQTSPGTALTDGSAGAVSETPIFSGRTANQAVSPTRRLDVLPVDIDDGAGAAALQPDGAAIGGNDLAFQQIDVADEVGDVARVGLLVDFGRRADLDDLAVVHHRDAVGQRHRLFLIVGDDDEGEAEIDLQVGQLELGLLAQLLVERPERLVEQQHLGLLGERAGKRDALALAAGKLVRLALGERRQLDQLQHLVDAHVDVGLPASPPA